MQESERLNLVGMQKLLEGSRAIRFSVSGREEVYELVRRVLKAQQYRKLSKGQRGMVRRFFLQSLGNEPGADDAAHSAMDEQAASPSRASRGVTGGRTSRCWPECASLG